MTDWATDWMFECAVEYLTGWQNDWLRNWLTDWLTVQLGTWLADRMTDWATDWLTDCPVGYLTGWQNDLLSNWLNDWLHVTEFTKWLTNCKQLTDWLSNWLRDWLGLQSRGQLNKTFTSVIYKCNLQVYPLSRVCVNHTLNKWTSLLHSSELQFSVFSHRGFW